VACALASSFWACTGVISNTPPQPDAGPPGNHALKFNGTSDYAQAGNANFVSSSTPQTVSLWYRAGEAREAGASEAGPGEAGTADAGGGTEDFLSLQKDTQSGFHLGIKQGMLAAWREFEDPQHPFLVAAALPAPGVWHHVAYVLQTTGGPEIDYYNYLYVDGALVGVGTLAPNNLTPILFMLGSSAQYTNHFAGELDEIRLWIVPLTQAKIQAEMLGQVGSVEPGLVAYFNCDQIVNGQLLLDQSGNGNNAVLGGGDARDMPTLVKSTVPEPSP
jgi:hypothetical protein